MNPKIFVASFNRASNGALTKLIERLKSSNMHIYDAYRATHVMAIGDRYETYDFVLRFYRKNIPIIHLWAGEHEGWNTHDDIYRTSMTLMSMMQLCTNEIAEKRVNMICNSVDKKPNAHVVGNIMLDNMYIDESGVPPETDYDVVLYNPPTCYTKGMVFDEVIQIKNMLNKYTIWIEPNGDMYSDVIEKYVTEKNLKRPIFLGLLKNCSRFITNSSCQYYEAPFVMEKGTIVPIGKRNTERESKYADMTIKNASQNVIDILKKELLYEEAI